MSAWATAVWVVVIALACFTTLAAAEVSLVLALVYWSVLVMIFVAPRGGAQALPVEAADGGESASPGLVEGVVVNDLHAAASPDPGATALDPPAAEADSREQPAWAPEQARPRRARARVRKPAKPVGEPGAEPAPATWVQVGPGRFVRADLAAAAAHAAGPIAAPDSLDAASLETGLEASADPVDSASAEAAEIGEIIEPSEPPSSDLEPPGATAPMDEGWNVEVYGNAPSAFEPSLSETPEEVEPAAAVHRNRAAFAPSTWRPRVVRTPPNAPPRFRRQGLIRGGNRRSVASASDASQKRIRRGADRAAGRTPHVVRGFRPRSPPGHGFPEARRAMIEPRAGM